MNEFDNRENLTEETYTAEETTINLEPEKEKKSCNSKTCNYLFMGILAVAVIVLYVLHFLPEKEETFTPKPVEGKAGSGEILYVNLDSINDNYLLVDQLTKEIEAKYSQMEANFAKREKELEQKSAQFQQNMNSGILTEVQAQYAYQELQAEYEQIMIDKENATLALQSEQANSISVIYDSIQKVADLINAERNASYILLYQSGSPFMLHADPTKDITDQILFELNKKEENK